MYRPYARHYNPRFVYFYPLFEVHLCTLCTLALCIVSIQERFLIKSGLQWHAYGSQNILRIPNGTAKELIFKNILHSVTRFQNFMQPKQCFLCQLVCKAKMTQQMFETAKICYKNLLHQSFYSRAGIELVLKVHLFPAATFNSIPSLFLQMFDLTYNHQIQQLVQK